MSEAGLTNVVDNLMVPITLAVGFMSTASLIVGMTCVFASFVRYRQHRSNPLAHPIGTVLALLGAGLVLLFLPLIYRLTESGVSPF